VTAWATIAALCAGTVVLKASGPVALRGRGVPPRAMAVIALVAPAVLTALVAYQTFGDTRPGLVLDARVVGLGVAAAGIAARLPMLAIVLLAAVATALTRALA
jgi:uncharacterized membrane protein